MARTRRIFSEYGTSGISRFGGTITEEYIPELRGEEGRRTLKQMASTDPTVGAMLFVIKQLVKSAEWETRTDFADESNEGKDAAQYIDEVLNDMSSSFETTIASICSMFTYGFDYKEIVYKERKGMKAKVPSKYNDGRIGIRKLAPRSQLTLKEWEFDKPGGIRGCWQENPDTGKRTFLPIEKCLLFRTEDENGSPEGRSIIANAFVPHYFLKNMREIQGIGVERDITGVLKVRLPADMFTDANLSGQLQEWKNLASNLRRDQLDGLLLPYDPNNPDLYDVSLIGSAGDRSFDIEAIIARLKAEIAQTCLTDFILLGHSAQGSFALSRSKTEALGIAAAGWLGMISGVINTHLIPKLMQLNPEFENLEHYPVVVPRLAKIPSYVEMASLVRSLAFANFKVSSSQEILNSILESYGLPSISDDEYEQMIEANVEGIIQPDVRLIRELNEMERQDLEREDEPEEFIVEGE